MLEQGLQEAAEIRQKFFIDHVASRFLKLIK
jgi:hypothetical protein